MKDYEDEALKLALEAITQYLAESPDPSDEAVERLCDAASAARKALAQPEQRSVSEHLEPVAYQCKGIPRKGCNYLAGCDMPCNKCGEIHHHHQMVWNHDNPQQRTWVGLTDADADDLFVETQRHMIGAGSREFTRIFTRLINAKLKEKNT